MTHRPPSAPAVVAITGGYVVPVASDPVEGGTVLVEDGVITAVGADVDVPEGATVLVATGRWVLPGFVEAHGHVGLHEEGEGVAGNDTNEMTQPNTAAVRALDAINIDDEGFRDALVGGVTSVVVKPGSGNPIGGQSVALKSWGGRTIDEQVISDAVSVKSALGRTPSGCTPRGSSCRPPGWAPRWSSARRSPGPGTTARRGPPGTGGASRPGRTSRWRC